MIYNIPYIAVVALILIGLYAIIFKRNLIKIVIGIILIESGVNLFLITLAFRIAEIILMEQEMFLAFMMK